VGDGGEGKRAGTDEGTVAPLVAHDLGPRSFSPESPSQRVVATDN